MIVTSLSEFVKATASSCSHALLPQQSCRHGYQTPDLLGHTEHGGDSCRYECNVYDAVFHLLGVVRSEPTTVADVTMYFGNEVSDLV
jgi:hypothetical protein